MGNNEKCEAQQATHSEPETTDTIEKTIDKEGRSYSESFRKIADKTRGAITVLMLLTAATISTGCNQKTHSAESAKDRQKLEESLRLETPEAVIFVLAHLKRLDPNASRLRKNAHRQKMDMSAEEFEDQLTINLTGTEKYSNEDLATTRRLLTERLNQILKSGDLDTLNSPGVQALLRRLSGYGYIELEDKKSGNNQESQESPHSEVHQSPQFEDDF